MNPGNRLEIVDRDGWRKEFPLDKPLLHVGSDGRNDVVLDTRRGAGVAPRQLQLIANPGGHGLRAINLGDGQLTLGRSGEKILAARSMAEVLDGDCLQLGEYMLVFHLADGGFGQELPPQPLGPARPARLEPAVGAMAGQVRGAERSGRAPGAERIAVPSTYAGLSARQASASIGLRLAFPRSGVEPDLPLEGMVTIQNLGEEPGAQFRLKVEGLEQDYYEIGAGPILFPKVEKGVYLRIVHPCGPAILAGKREVVVRATAPDAYPGESVAVSQVVEFLPYYRHQLRLVPIK